MATEVEESRRIATKTVLKSTAPPCHVDRHGRSEISFVRVAWCHLIIKVVKEFEQDR